MTSTTYHLLAAASAVTLAAACATEADYDAGSEPVYVASDKVWPTATIPVCWENHNGARGLGRAIVRDAVRNSWESVSAVTFTGWGACTPNDKGIRIRVEDVAPHVKALGTGLAGLTDGMVLNFSFVDWNPSCGANPEPCIAAIAVHEFGHALGFAHEQNRPDTPAWCDEEQGPDGDAVIGAWDVDSVMNECNPAWNGKGVLSSSDIIGVQQLYGHRFDPSAYHRVGSARLGSARSLDGTATPRLGISGRRAGQRWRIAPLSDGYYRLTNKSFGPTHALEATPDGTLVMARADRAGGQRWRLTPNDDGTVRLTTAQLGPGRSLTMTAGRTPTLELAATSAVLGQRWTID